MTKNTATINDVAARAGVSIKTVSRVLNKSPNVRPATRERVSDAIKALDYRPNPVAVTLGRMRRRTPAPALSA
jgi:LacI family transcriptional regulator